MKTYARLNNGTIEFAPAVMRRDKKTIIGYNLEKNEEMLLTDGYKILADCEKNNDGRAYDLSWSEDDTYIYKKWVPHVYGDAELESIRNRLYGEISDKILAKVQRGAAEPEEYIRAVAQIKHEHRYSDESARTYNDFFNEAARMWNEVNADRPVSLRE